MLGKSIFYKINLFVSKAKRLLASNRVCQQLLLSHLGIGFQLKPILLMTPSPCWKLTQKSILVLMVEVFGRHGIWSIIFISKILGQMIGSVIKCDLGSISSTLLCTTRFSMKGIIQFYQQNCGQQQTLPVRKTRTYAQLLCCMQKNEA